MKMGVTYKYGDEYTITVDFEMLKLFTECLKQTTIKTIENDIVNTELIEGFKKLNSLVKENEYYEDLRSITNTTTTAENKCSDGHGNVERNQIDVETAD